MKLIPGEYFSSFLQKKEEFQCRVMVQNDEHLTKAVLNSYFSKYGKVTSVELPFEQSNKETTSIFTWVWFQTASEAEAAFKDAKSKGNVRKHFLEGSYIVIQVSKIWGVFIYC